MKLSRALVPSLLAVSLAMPLSMPSTLSAQARPDASPGIVRQTPAPAVYRFAIGEARVTALSDGTVPIDLHTLLRGIEQGETDALLAHGFLRNPVEASINAFLIETGGRRILVDTGAGELFGPGNGGRLPEALQAIGLPPGDISDILITHVHSDHSGGLVRGGRMIFPNATVHVGAPDVEFFLDARNAQRTGYERRYFDEAAATLKPYVDAGKIRAFERDGEILPGIRAELHPGHTPGTAFYTLESAGQRLVFIGDIIHVAAVQFPRPEVTITFDLDQNKARGVREKAFAAFTRGQTMIAAPHLPFPGVGHLRADGKGYRWFPVDHGDRDPGSNELKL